MQEENAAIILAAGTLLWAPLSGRIVLARTIDVFQASPLIAAIILVTDAPRLQEGEALCRREGWRKVAAVVATDTGAHRRDCVRAGLEALARVAPACRRVALHDGARPFVSETLLAAGLQAAQEHQAAIAAVPVKDTIKQVEQGRIRATLDRAQLWSVQTPQIFSFPLIHNAYLAPQTQEETADAAILLTQPGQDVTIFPGSYSNIKITTQEDLLLAEALLQEFSAP